MSLTATQRNFLITQLGAVPRERKFFQSKTTEEVKADDYVALEAEAMRLQLSLETTLGTTLKIVQDYEKKFKEIQEGVKKLTKDNEGTVYTEAKKNLTVLVDRLKKAEPLAKNYAAALKEAKAELLKVDKDINLVDKLRIQNDMIDPAPVLANEGSFYPAIELLEKAKEECAKAKSFKSAGGKGDWWGAEYEKLRNHAQKDAFKKEIARLEKLFIAARDTHLKGGSTGNATAANSLFSKVHWGALNEVVLADAHGKYLEKKAEIQVLIDDVTTGDPKTANAFVATDVSTISTDLAKAEKKATSRLYEISGTILEDIRTRCTALKKVKTDYDAHLTELGNVELLVAGLKADPGGASEGEISAIKAKLEKAKQTATNRDFAGSKTLLAEVKTSCETVNQLKENYGKDLEEKKQAVAGLDTATEDSAIRTSLEKVKQMYEKLKTRAGHEALVEELGKIDTALKAAEQALA